MESVRSWTILAWHLPRKTQPRVQTGSRDAVCFPRPWLPPASSGNRTPMSTYPDPTLHGDVHPSEEEIDPAGVSGPVGGHASRPGPSARRVATTARSIVSRRADGSVEVVTDIDGDGVADVVQ